MEIREATAQDAPSVVELLATARGRPATSQFRPLLQWKHEENPFGRSLQWVIAWQDGLVAVPGPAPMLTWRSLCASGPPPLGEWALTMGDIELF